MVVSRIDMRSKVATSTCFFSTTGKLVIRSLVGWVFAGDTDKTDG